MNQNTKIESAVEGDDYKIPTVTHRFNPSTNKMTMQLKTEPFLKGPISIAWLQRAAHFPGKTINVALAIRWLSDMNSNKPIKLTRKALEYFNVSSDAATGALNRMADDGLITLEKKPGQRPLIKLLSID